MNSRTKLNANKTRGGVIGLCILGLSCILLPLPQLAQDANHPMCTEIDRFGSAEAKMVTRNSGFYPSRQPEVYWHDDDWRIDLLPLASLEDTYKLNVSSGGGDAMSVVQLPALYGEIREILRNPDNKAIVVANIGGSVTSFCIVDLEQGKVIDQVAMYSPSISPDRRFIVYVNGFAPHGSYAESEYHLYDTFKTPRENTCGFRENDPEHKDLDESYRGFQVYPLMPKGDPCLGALPAGEDHQRVSDFIWSADSSKVVFADALNGIITLVVVQMPTTAKGLPQTFVHPLTGTENVCEKECSFRNVVSLVWQDGGIQASLEYIPQAGPSIERTLTLPLPDFPPAPR